MNNHFTMYFSETFTIIGSKIWKAVLFICVVQLASASQCFSSGNVSCDCDNAKAECSGIQTSISEVQDILANFTSMSNIIIEIINLQFEHDFKLGRNMNVTNMSLGYGLQTLPSNIFLEMGTSLISLKLQNNSIKLIDDKLFSTLNSLNELFLDMNELNELESSMFANLFNLKYLSISNNYFHEVTPDTFQNLLSLHTLIVSHNNFSLFGNVNIKSIYLYVLKVEGCGIQGALENDTFSEVPNLEELNLAHNEISEVKPNSLSALKNLKYLNLSYNVIEFLQENAFMELNNLTHLDLKSNKISIIKMTSFTNLRNLEYLDLSRNRLKAFLCEYTTDFAQLKTMNLQDNKIKTFTIGAFYYSPLLEKLDITGNNLECSCELTDIYLYLIDNSTMKLEDLHSVYCTILATHEYRSITSYKSSKCIAQEPCKKLTDNSFDDEDDYLDETENTTTSDTTSTSPTTLVAFTATNSTKISTKTNTDASITSTKITTDSTLTSTETTTNFPIITTIFTTTLIASPSLDDNTGLPTTLSAIISSASVVSTDTPTNSPEKSTTAVTSAIAQSTSDNGSFSDPETTTIPLTTVKNITTSTEVTNFTDPITVSMPNDNLTTLYSITDSVSNSASETSTIGDNTTAVYSTVNSAILNETITATLQATSSVTYSSTKKTTTTSEKISTTVISTPKKSCSSLELSLESLTSDPKIIVLKNFSYDDDTFCLKWTIGGDLPPKIRCILKYSFIKGTKSEYTKCPSVPGEVKLWTKNEKIFKFCLDVYVNIKVSSCEIVSAKTTPRNFIHTTIANITYLKTDISSKATTFSTDDRSTASSRFMDTDTSTRAATLSTDSYAETSALTGVSTLIPNTSSYSSDETSFKTDSASTEFNPIIYPSHFNITSFDVFFNDSSFAYVKWTVSKEEPLNLCSLTLTATTQYFDHHEGVFPCKKHTHQLQNVKEGEIFKACLVSHDSSGYDIICKYSLTGANFNAEASKGKDHATSNSSSFLIPLICLLILLVLIVLFIIFKNLYRKKLESDRYDVRAEEEKSQRVEIRSSSSHGRSSIRDSYIAKENPDI